MKLKYIYPVITVNYDNNGNERTRNINNEVNTFLAQDEKTIKIVKIVQYTGDNGVFIYYKDSIQVNNSLAQPPDRFSDLDVDHED